MVDKKRRMLVTDNDCSYSIPDVVMVVIVVVERDHWALSSSLSSRVLSYGWIRR